jgi:hypothetical protein
MKKIHLLALILTFLIVNVAFAANEIHWTVTGPDAVTFSWRGTTAEKTIGYGTTSGAYTMVTARTPNPVPVSSKGPFWEAELTGLTANTRYYYKIGTMPERSFRTPPAPGSSNFNIYAEGNIGSSSTYFNTGAVQDIIANDLPSFVVGLGDLTLGTLDGRAAVDQHFNDVMVWSKEAAYMPVWGDADTASSTNDNFKNYKGRFAVPNPQTSPGSPLAGGEDWYWFDYGNVRFITLPEPWTGAWADWMTKADSLMAQAQSDPNIKFIVTFVHRAAYSSGHVTGSPELRANLDKLGDTYSKYKLNVNAHSNNYERSFPQHGVTHVTAGTGGADLNQDGTCLWLTCTKPEWSAFRAMHHGALKIRFTSSSIEGSFICGPTTDDAINDVSCTEGSVVDKFVISGPVISAVSVFSITQDGAKISWKLDQPATGQVEYGTTTSYGYMSTKETSYYSTHIQQLSDLAPLTQYHFRVHSSSQAGVESVSGDFTFTTTAAVDTTAPSVPANLTATTISSTQINLSWNASTDNVAVTGYKVFRNGTQIATVTGTSYSNTGLAPSTAYSYTVSSYDAAGNSSANSVTVNAKTNPSSTVQLPDVIVTSISYANGIFTSTVKNQGVAATPAGAVVGVGYFVDGVQRTWGAVSGPLAAGASVTIGTGGAPYTIPTGTHTINAYADDINRFAESDETNNQLTQSITVGSPPPLPDVIVTSVSYANGIFTSTVKNQGTAATPTGTIIGVGYSVDGVWKTWGSVNGPLAAGASVTIGTGGAPYTIPTGTHTINAYADDVNRFKESNETNNQFSQSITVGGTVSNASKPLFGFAGHFWGPYANTSGATVLDLVKQVGGSIYRVDLGTNTYGLADQLVAAAPSRNIQLIGILFNGGEHDYNSSFNEAKAFAQKYAGKIQYYQVSNERDIHSGAVAGDGVNPGDYNTAGYTVSREMIRGLIDGVKAGDPNAKTIVNFTWLHYGFIQRLVNDGVKFDIIGVDWYWEDIMKVRGNFDLTAYIKNTFNKPLFVTEWNRWEGSTGGNETAQANYITQHVASMCNNPNISVATVYELLDEPGAGGFEANMGLMYNTTSPKPAYSAYKTAIADCQK